MTFIVRVLLHSRSVCPVVVTTATMCALAAITGRRLDKVAYPRRTTIERCFRRCKHFRAIATAMIKGRHLEVVA